MHHQLRGGLLVCLWAASLASLPCSAVAGSRPNIVVVLTDDMGFSDLGCFGGEIDTPNLDALAAGGLRFTQFYNTARCCPTRASLLTGLYPHQAGMGHMVGNARKNPTPAYRNVLNRRCVTIAEALRTSDYRSYMVGKWHVSPDNTRDRKPRTGNWPVGRGFDRFYGTIAGGGNYFDPFALIKDKTPITAPSDPEYRPENGYYYTDAIADHAVRFIDEHARDHQEQPFFLYVAFTAAHWPMQAREETIAKYRGRFDAGYDALRAARFERAKKLGVIDANWRLTPQRGGKLDAVANREWELRCMETYAAMVDSMDQGVGRTVKALAAHGLGDDTLVLYMQDNGACAELMGRREGQVGGPRTDKPEFPALADDYKMTTLVPPQTRDGYPIRQGVGAMPGPADTFIGYGEAWANVSNTPFREYKHWVHEGGISTPLIAHWPAGIKARGELRGDPAHLIDVMATCVDLAGAEYPAEKDGKKIHPLEGVSLRPAFAGQPLNRQQPIFWEHEGNRAVRDGRWKLVAKGPGGPWELYDMNVDRTEVNDLAVAQPERVRKMVGQWEAWATRVGAIPWPRKPQYKAAKVEGAAGAVVK